MTFTESITQFYQRATNIDPTELPENNTGLGHFNVFLRESCAHVTNYSRRDFYKVSLIIGTGKLYYADKWIVIDKPALLFTNPVVPYAWEPGSQLQQGWFCLFTETFLLGADKHEGLQQSPLFKIGGNPVYFLNDAQLEEISAIFNKMTKEINTSYIHKYSVLRNYLHLIIHEAMKMEPVEKFEKHSNASARISNLFIELLERQFPIDMPDVPLKFRSANDFANSLSVHVNHLNKAVKDNTGKSTTEIIAARIVQEAKALLQHTEWNIAEISYSLGFEYPAYFSNFLKKHAGVSPSKIRQLVI